MPKTTGLIWLFFTACGTTVSPLVPSNSGTTPPPVASDHLVCASDQEPRSTETRYECTTDEECVSTCAYGAIHRYWLPYLQSACQDGCASKGMQARCVEKRCTSFGHRGKRDNYCSTRPAPTKVCVNRGER